MYGDDENLNSAEKPKKIFSMLVLLLVALLVSCAIMFYVVAPIYRESKIIKIGNETKEEIIENNNLALIKIIKANDESKEFNSENVEKIKEFIPNRNNYEDYLIHIVKFANEKNIKINDLSVNKIEDDPRKKSKSILSEVEINFTASSGYLNLISFLKSIEKSIPFVQEESMSISIGEEEDDLNENANTNPDVETVADSILDYEIRLKFYYY